MQTDISVVIPLHNKALYIERTLGSVLVQTCPALEIIVIDDGSTDGGAEIVSNIKVDRIRLIQQENRGQSGARNRGIVESSGRLIAMLDADDEWQPQFLETVVGMQQRFPQAGIYATGYKTSYSGNLVIETTLEPANHHKQFLVSDYFRRARVADFVCSSAQAVPRAVYETVGFYPEGEPIGEDLDMWGRIALKLPIAYDVRSLAIYHSEATGGTVLRWISKPTFPPFVRSARQAVARGEVMPEQLPDLYEYLNHLLLRYVENVIASRDRKELWRAMREELYPTQVYRSEAGFLRVAGRFLPMSLLYLLLRVRSSRWLVYWRRQQVQNGVVRRVIPVEKRLPVVGAT